MKCRSAVAAIVVGVVANVALGAHLPNFDAVAEAPRVDAASSRQAVAALAATSAARVQWDDRFGVPTFLWPRSTKPAAAMAGARLPKTSEAAARAFLSDYASLYRLDSADIADAHVAGIHDTGRGAIVVKLRQKIAGVDVFRDEMNVVLNRERDLVALSGHISALPRNNRLVANSVQASPFPLTPSSAIITASCNGGQRPSAVPTAVGGCAPLDLRLRGEAEGGYQLYEGPWSEPVRIRRVYFHLPDRYEPAYYLELDSYSYVISALDGRLLFRNHLAADQSAPAAFSYRVWASGEGDHPPFSGPQGYDGTPSPTGLADGYQPFFIQPNLITLAYGTISTGDPWLAESATETVGNNVDAYADLIPPDGYSAGDFRASTTAGLMFDRTYDVTRPPAASDQQQMAAITQLFYDTNFLHDWYYDAGFNEAAGNAQTSNFGRGGLANDSLRAEADDYSGRNNANMITPADGGRPRMQMFVWDGPGNRMLRVNSPLSIAKPYATGGALFGPQSFDLNGEVAGTTPADGCSPITSNLSGKIAFIDRGGVNCTFRLKVQNAKAAGAIAVIIGNVASSAIPEGIATMGCGISGCTTADATLPPALLVALSDANVFRSQLGSGIRVLMHRDPAVDRDGTIDNQIVAHEWMHYMTGRLIGDGNGLTSVQARGMGEGWSDFSALLLTARPEDTRFASNAAFNGAYATAVYATTGGTNGPTMNNGAYFGIRRLPYSTDLTRNPLTLGHVMNGVAIPDVPIRFGADGGNNAQVHNTGEVWCTMLWEVYASLLRDTLGNNPRLTFIEAQRRMKEYLVASLRITPPNPTFLEARDALLAAAFARDKADYQNFWRAFGKRGAGIAAVAPDRHSDINAGAVEDFNGSGGMIVLSVTLDDSVASCLRNGVLDGGESGEMRITLRNAGAIRLQSTTVQVGSSDPTLSFANGGTATVPASFPGETVTAIVNASLAAGAGSVLKPDITIGIHDPQIGAAEGMTSVYQARLNAFEAPKDSSSDDVESSATSWSVAGSGAAQWTRLEISPRDHRWFAPEPDSATDQWLISPPLVVATAGDFGFSFRHRFAFDYFQEGFLAYVDGGVIEITADDGRTWADIGDSIDRATTHYGDTGIFGGNGSAIEGRKAFEGVSPGYNASMPSISPFTSTLVNLGPGYAGKRVRIRFRFVTGADHSFTPRLGWEIDDIVFNNITNLPFATVVGDRGFCTVSSTGITLVASTDTLQTGQLSVFSATVAASSAATGTVDFYDNGAILGTARIDSGTARLTTTALPAGTHAITATFNGGKYFAASTSATVTVEVVSSGRRRSVH